MTLQLLAEAFHRTGWYGTGKPLPLVGLGQQVTSLAEQTTQAQVLTRLFELGEHMPSRTVKQIIGESAYAVAIKAHLLHTMGEKVYCPGTITRYGSEQATLWLYGDQDLATSQRELSSEHVSAVTAAAVTLRQLVGDKPEKKVLDLGCGCGIQALSLAQTGSQVVATDISDRALAYTRVNTELNQLTLDIRSGSLYEPVGADRFDVICSNAPFVITPPRQSQRLIYRDAGFNGDGFIEALIKGAAQHLTTHGKAIFLANWLITDPGEPAGNLPTWLSAAGLDGWVMLRDQLTPADYGAHWVRDAGISGPAAVTQCHDWAQWLTSLGAIGVGMGFIVATLAPRDRAPHIRVDRAQVGQPLPSPTHINQVLAGISRSAESNDTEIGASYPKACAQLCESRSLELGTGRIDSHTIVATGTDAALGQLGVDAAGIAVLGALDGDLSVDQAATAVAALMEYDADTIRQSARALVREASERGLYTW